MIRVLLFVTVLLWSTGNLVAFQTENPKQDKREAAEKKAGDVKQVSGSEQDKQAVAAKDQEQEESSEPAKTKPTTTAKPENPVDAKTAPSQYVGSPIEPDGWPEVTTEGGLKVESVAGPLDHPFALAIHPQSDEVYVSESGQGRVVKIANKTKTTVVAGFKKNPLSLGVEFQVGPLGISFLDPNHLIVAGDSGAETTSLISIYQLPAQGKQPSTAEQPKSSHGIKPLAESAKNGIGYGLVVTGEGVYATTDFESEKGWLLHADKIGTKLSNLKRFVATSEKSKIGTPMGITRAMSVGYFAVGEAGDFQKPGDSVLTYYDERAELLATPFPTGLNDIVGLAFSPKRQRLFAVDFSVAEPEKAGLYKLIADGENGCTAELIVNLARPTACAFDKKGNLFITVLGDDQDGEQPSGRLLKISGLDEASKPKVVSR